MLSNPVQFLLSGPVEMSPSIRSEPCCHRSRLCRSGQNGESAFPQHGIERGIRRGVPRSSCACSLAEGPGELCQLNKEINPGYAGEKKSCGCEFRGTDGCTRRIGATTDWMPEEHVGRYGFASSLEKALDHIYNSLENSAMRSGCRMSYVEIRYMHWYSTWGYYV